MDQFSQVTARTKVRDRRSIVKTIAKSIAFYWEMRIFENLNKIVALRQQNLAPSTADLIIRASHHTIHPLFILLFERF